MINILKIASVFLVASVMSGCSPEVGSKGWCEKMDKMPKGEWRANDAKEYATNCIFRKTE